MCILNLIDFMNPTHTIPALLPNKYAAGNTSRARFYTKTIVKKNSN